VVEDGAWIACAPIIAGVFVFFDLPAWKIWLRCPGSRLEAGQSSSKKVVAKLDLGLVTDKLVYYSVNGPEEPPL
jgi:hypothetical protein